MAKIIEYDVSDVEESTGGTGLKAKPAVYVCEIMRAAYRTEKRDGSPANDIELALSVGDEYDWVFTYVGLDKASDWKLAEFTRAIGLPDKGKINVDKLKGKVFRVKLNSGEFGGAYRPDAGKFFPAQEGDAVGNKLSEASQNGSAGGTAEPEADEPEATGPQYKEGFVPSREDDPEIGSYDDWSEADLLAEVEDRGATLPGGRASKKDKAIAALRAEDESVTAVAEGAADKPAAEPAAAADADDYDTWDLEALIKEYNERNFDDPAPVKKGSNAEARTKAAIIEIIRADDNGNPFEG